ncbi:3'-5' exoribonuclease [Gilvimarinus agarilyticus]|uniref:exonuclease domain-containing protein n=1 Tax=Reichenbachiella agariperforans TaxID=156994 RepID=UPI001C0865B1|nr:exonuclease domain-containing protein [Reichenbachiella agariperforans]MBU2887943.1 3'-5' exoribonuclease [Gilvimarinus agarilyticus]MBU2913391.1 3'-5' exoribonuclease [Reichenbachiella agariperforans]
MKYIAIDVETANSDYSSLCQIGLARFENGEVVDTWSSLINPKEHFDQFNIELHGIDEETVKDAPTFNDIYEQLKSWMTEQVSIHHMPFDWIAITRACEKYKLSPIETEWLDSAKITRRTWEQFAYKGYSLASISEFLDIEFQHHDALEDAIAAGKVVFEACKLKNLNIHEWVERVNKPINLYKGGSSIINLEGNSEGTFYGENVVFTGTLSLTRHEAGTLAANLGCNVTNSVTKKTTMLIVGLQDSYKLGGFEKSSKHRKAEELVKNGQQIKIFSENDFRKIVELNKNSL